MFLYFQSALRLTGTPPAGTASDMSGMQRLIHVQALQEEKRAASSSLTYRGFSGRPLQIFHRLAVGAERPLVDLPRGPSLTRLPHVDVLPAVSANETTCRSDVKHLRSHTNTRICLSCICLFYQTAVVAISFQCNQLETSSPCSQHCQKI